MRSPSPRSKNALSIFLGLWLGLTVIAGLSVFALFFWALGGSPPANTQPPPTAATPTPIPQVTTGPKAPVQSACTYPPPPASGFGYGIQSHIFPGEDDIPLWMDVIRNRLGFQWVKVQLRWADMEEDRGSIGWDSFMDNLMKEACAKGVRVMFSAVTAPTWTQANPLPAPEGQSAPPDDYQAYVNFLSALIDRYPGQISAIEVWNEQNLEREWNTAGGVSPAEYVKMLQLAYTAIKSKDPNIIVISGALAPTGINCHGSFPDCQPSGRVVVMDDATYLTQFVQAGGLNYADCIGTHSNGTNLPPTTDAMNPPGDGSGYSFRGPWENKHYSWSLKSQVETYAAILNRQKKQCVTEFGYASAVNGHFPPNYGFAADITEQQQGQFLVAALDWMRGSGLVQMAFVFNLDYGPKGGDPASDDNVIFSILSPQGVPRPAFDALSLMAKP